MDVMVVPFGLRDTPVEREIPFDALRLLLPKISIRSLKPL
jgi:hypothetical protein